MPLEAVSPDDPPLPKPKLPKPEPKAPDVFAIPAHHTQQCRHCINASSANGTFEPHNTNTLAQKPSSSVW